jgi:hypothetical protein
MIFRTCRGELIVVACALEAAINQTLQEAMDKRCDAFSGRIPGPVGCSGHYPGDR